MAINKKILAKLAEKTNDEKAIRQFLTAIFQFETTPKTGWYEKPYSELLEKYCEEGDDT